MIKPVYFPKVETKYRVWIEWDIKSDKKGDPDVCDATRELRKLKCPKSVEWNDRGGGPCWNAYMIITGSRKDSVEKFARKALRLMARYKKLKIYHGAECRAAQ
jgi:hypothetical protein